ncbi:MAG: hypothetical protein H3C63_10390 [Candidatus Omnitrophica bacterium]|nr:hypothetical protein [Candidatus Omnitrophota bacterium]
MENYFKLQETEVLSLRGVETQNYEKSFDFFGYCARSFSAGDLWLRKFFRASTTEKACTENHRQEARRDSSHR